MARRRSLTGVQQAGVRLGLTLEALANTDRKVTVDGKEGKIKDHEVVGAGLSWRIRYRVLVRHVGLVWCGTVAFV